MSSSETTIRNGKEAEDTAKRIAFLAHPADLAQLRQIDRNLAIISDTQLQRLLNLVEDDAKVFVASTFSVEIPEAKLLLVDIIIIPLLASQLVGLPRERAVELIKKAHRLAVSRGATLIGLGGFTSVLSQAGIDLRGQGAAITTGNTYTACVGLQLLDRLRLAGGNATDLFSACILGPFGSIGSLLFFDLALRTNRLNLCVRPSSRVLQLKRLRSLVGRFLNANAGISEFREGSIAAKLAAITPELGSEAFALQLNEVGIALCDDFDTAAIACSAVIIASSDVSPNISVANCRPGAVVVDISTPSVIPQDQFRGDVTVVAGGLVKIPRAIDTDLNMGLEKGIIHACLAETILLGLIDHNDDVGVGLAEEFRTFRFLASAAEQFGFSAARGAG